MDTQPVEMWGVRYLLDCGMYDDVNRDVLTGHFVEAWRREQEHEGRAPTGEVTVIYRDTRTDLAVRDDWSLPDGKDYVVAFVKGHAS